MEKLIIGVTPTLGTMPFVSPLRAMAPDNNWEIVEGGFEDMDDMLDQGAVDVALCSPLAPTLAPTDYLVFPDVGYGGRRHMRDMLFFSDLLLDDMDEMTVSLPDGFVTAQMIVKLVMGKYLQYQNPFIDGWGNADAFVLAGDAALRERLLDRYTYVYDVGDLWRHYTGKALAYYIWTVRKESARKKGDMLYLLYRILRKCARDVRADANNVLVPEAGYDWIKKAAMIQLWNKVEYELQPEHFEGLVKFYDDLADFGMIEDPPELEFFEGD